MTTAHRPTFDPARGKDAQRGPSYHQRLTPAYTHLKFRQPGQGGEADESARDLRAELLAAEAAHFAKKNGGVVAPSAPESSAAGNLKRPLKGGSDGDADEEEDVDSKRRRILEETRDIDADSDDDDDDGDASKDGEEKDDEDDEDDDDDDDSEDEMAELQREVERIRRERQEKKEKEERERELEEQEAKERDIAMGNPLLNQPTNFNIKRRWNDDVVFKNQARGTDDKDKKKEFINDMLRSDFHKRFMNKYVR